MKTFREWREGQPLYQEFKSVYDREAELKKQRDDYDETVSLKRKDIRRTIKDEDARSDALRQLDDEFPGGWEDSHPWSSELDELDDTTYQITKVLQKQYRKWLRKDGWKTTE
jgi:hypothetical protein